MTRATLRTTSWDAIYTYLQTTNPISTNNIFSAYNSGLVRDKGYPLVIISPPSASFEKLSANGTMTASEVNMLIEIYDDNSQDTKAMADEVTAKLIAGRTTFCSSGLKNMNIDEGDYTAWQEGDKKIHRIGFTVSFRFISD
jgi:hypothetical protein